MSGRTDFVTARQMSTNWWAGPIVVTRDGTIGEQDTQAQRRNLRRFQAHP